MSVLIDEAAHLRTRARAAAGYSGHDFLKKTVAGRMAERLDAVRAHLARAVDIGCHGGEMSMALMAHERVGEVTAVDPAPEMAALAAHRGINAIAAPYDDLPFDAGSLDGVFSALALHWVDDLPGMLARLAGLLKPDGLLLVALPGGNTLATLRGALAEAESEIVGGISPRIMPMADIRDLGGLLGRAGLALPVADSDTIRITWPHAHALMADLRGMAESNALMGRRKSFTPKKVMDRCAEIMAARAGTADGKIEEVFEIITLTGWAPHPRQQKPLRPGSGKQNLGKALE